MQQTKLFFTRSFSKFLRYCSELHPINDREGLSVINVISWDPKRTPRDSDSLSLMMKSYSIWMHRLWSMMWSAINRYRNTLLTTYTSQKEEIKHLTCAYILHFCQVSHFCIFSTDVIFVSSVHLTQKHTDFSTCMYNLSKLPTHTSIVYNKSIIWSIPAFSVRFIRCLVLRRIETD